jgi:outer membrane protein
VRAFQPIEEPIPPAPGIDVSVFVDEAIKNRPELAGQRFNVQSAESYAKAERDLWFPTLTGEGVAGLVPVIAAGGLAATTLPAPRYAAAGFNLNIPIFNGHEFGALRAEANYQARAQNDYLRDLQDRVVRDVTTAWLNAKSGFEELSVTQQLLDEADQALELAQSRYQLGLSSIVELTQAQLNQTQAQIDQAGAKYDYETEISVLNYEIGSTP